MDRRTVVVIALAALVVACQSTPPSPPPSPSPSPGPAVSPSAPSPTVSASAEPVSPSPTTNPSASEPTLGNRRVNVLFIGSDNSKRRRASALTDSLIVVSLDPVAKTVSLLGLPRDLTDFPLPGGAIYHQKINSLYSQIKRDPTRFSGKRGDDPYVVLAGVIGNLIRLPVDQYVTVDMDGFVGLIDALDGVDVYVDRAVCDPGYRHAGVRGFEVRPGWWHVTGPQALALARVRHDAGGSDFHRMRRQQDLLVAIYERALEKGIGSDPLAWLDKIPTMRTNVPPTTVLAAVGLASDVTPDRFRSRLIQPFGRGGVEAYDGRGYVLKAQIDEIRDTAKALFTKPGRAPSTGRQEAPPKEPTNPKRLPRFNGC